MMANRYQHRLPLPVGFLLLVCVLFLYKYLEVKSQDYFPIIVDNAEDYININTFRSQGRSVAELLELINRHNEDPKVMNSVLPSSMRKYMAVVTIQVRSNTASLENLIQTLKEAMGIQNSLLIFSHETYDDQINELVKNITFTKYMQIFYPHSIQLNPKTFPGDDSKFCVDDLNCEVNNGHRNATEVQKKHHWWWTVNYIFDHLKPIEQHKGIVVFLEEDQYVTKDFIYILTMLEYTQKVYCPYCTILSLAVLKPNIANYKNPLIIKIKDVSSTQELMGIGFNRTIWKEIKNLTDYFCTFNDVDWTRSFVHSVTISPNTNCSILAINGPRVFRFDTCPYCGDSQKVERNRALMSKIKNDLFPKSGDIGSIKGHTSNTSKGYGGWDDWRDHLFCKNFTRFTTRDDSGK